MKLPLVALKLVVKKLVVEAEVKNALEAKRLVLVAFVRIALVP
jgi:hypothetical protein